MSKVTRKKSHEERPCNTVALSFSLVSTSADSVDKNRMRGNSPESNTGYVDLSEYASLEERLREAEEAKTVKKLEEEASPPKEEKTKGKKQKEAGDEGDAEDDADTEEEDADDDDFIGGDDEDE